MGLRQINVGYDPTTNMVVLPKQTNRFKIRSILLHFLASATDPSEAEIRFIFGGVAKVFTSFTGGVSPGTWSDVCLYEGATYTIVTNANWGYHDIYTAIPLPKNLILDSNWAVEIEFNSWNPANLPQSVDVTSFFIEDILDAVTAGQ